MGFLFQVCCRVGVLWVCGITGLMISAFLDLVWWCGLCGCGLWRHLHSGLVLCVCLLFNLLAEFGVVLVWGCGA